MKPARRCDKRGLDASAVRGGYFGNCGEGCGTCSLLRKWHEGEEPQPPPCFVEWYHNYLIKRRRGRRARKRL
jgi:hypothetical protein